MVHSAPYLVYIAPWLAACSRGPIAPSGGASLRLATANQTTGVLRLLAETEVEYRHVRVLTSPVGENAAQRLSAEIAALGPDVDVRVLPITDPSDHGQIFHALRGVTDGLPPLPLDVCLSAGTPQMQTLWVIMVEAGLLPARMLQVIPPAFVPSVHPRSIREVVLDIDGFPEIRALREEVVRLRAEGGRRTVVGDSSAMTELFRRLRRVARSEVPVLIEGETGTGKELAARAVHEHSRRAQGAFVAESCGAFADGVLASELFGHEKGAFTGALSRRRGLFEQADGGTLFLDEVGEMSPRVQVMLLRVLQEGTLRRVGGEQPIDVDVRVIAATHRDLRQMIARGEFREDLYYRLSGTSLRIPPLRERMGDLEGLVASVLDELGGPRPWPTAQAWRCLQAYRWPGNVRQLRAEVVRWTVFCERQVRVEDLSIEIREAGSDERAGPPAPAALGRREPVAATGQDARSACTLADAVAEVEARMIRAALAREGSLLGAARALAIDRNTLKRKLQGLGLQVKPGPRGKLVEG